MNLESNKLKDWEIQTIDALAQEALERASEKEFVRHPGRFVESYIAELQRDTLVQPAVRRSLGKVADRLHIGHKHPPRISEIEELPEPDDVLAARWARMTFLKIYAEPDHEFCRMFHRLVTEPTTHAQRNRSAWPTLAEAERIINELEATAARLGLIEDTSAPPAGKSLAIVKRFLMTIGSVKPRARPAPVATPEPDLADKLRAALETA